MDTCNYSQEWYQNKWTIRVRVASKPSIREWSNSRGQGKVFNVDLVDESVHIRCAIMICCLNIVCNIILFVK